MTRRLAIAAVALGIPLLGADATMACSCVPLKPRQQLKASDAAFIGRLIEVHEVSPPVEGAGISTGDPVDHVYRVGRIYKDGPGINRRRRVRVRSVRGEATCGLPSRIGELIGLFVQDRNHRWHGNLCLTMTARKMRRAFEGASASRILPPLRTRCSPARSAR
jgi:hypothetical protein